MTAEEQKRRSARVKELIKEIISSSIIEFKNEKIGFVTITDVEVTPDLRHAKIYYTVLGNEEQRNTTKDILTSGIRFFRRQIAASTRIKFVPEIEFCYDDTCDRVIRMEEIFQKIRNEK
jgi:ribosome-binding factor A